MLSRRTERRSSWTWLPWRTLALILAVIATLPGTAVQAVPSPSVSGTSHASLADEGELAMLAEPSHIALQVGHWRINELPAELARLRTSTGGSGGGVREVDVNLAVAERAAERLRELGHTVDVLPATVPPGYQADVFLAIHADAVRSPAPRGYKLARSRWSRLPATDDALVAAVSEEYRQATGLPWSPAITGAMTGYYAFSNWGVRHSVHPTTPAAIIELGYVTNAADRAVLTAGVDRVVSGIVRGLLRFLAERGSSAAREQLASAPAVNCRTFPQSGHALCGSFRRYWEENGSVARFGYPISDEQSEYDSKTDRTYTVQYFERARFEHHPESAPPHDIALGLIGRMATAGREDELPFRPIDPFDDYDERRYFPETGHSLAGGFKAYWEEHDGVHTFGLPISEEFTEANPDTGEEYTVQYFERARFEYHPERAGTPDEIQLGLLGRQVYRPVH
jgi:hypothetical protein